MEEKEKLVKEGESFESWRSRITKCRFCQDKFGFEPRPIVFGNQHAKILQISQAPSLRVYQTGKPFHDLSGKKLIQEWYQIPEDDFYDPDLFYIVSMAHCYPGKNKKGGDNPPPPICYEKWVKQEISYVDSKLIVVVGAKAAERLFPKVPFLELVMHTQEREGKPVLVFPHPSPLNLKWLKDHPEFETKRLPKMREMIHQTLY